MLTSVRQRRYARDSEDAIIEKCMEEVEVMSQQFYSVTELCIEIQQHTITCDLFHFHIPHVFFLIQSVRNHKC